MLLLIIRHHNFQELHFRKHFLVLIFLVTELSPAFLDLVFKDKLMLGGDEEKFHSFLISIFIQVGMLLSY